jgi:ATP-dependent Clp protease adaptor protein ClpS
MSDDDRKRRDAGGPGTAVITKTKPQTKRPNLYRVLLLNDDYTPMEFVVHVLERFFNKDRDAATRIMLHVHHHGVGECGIYTYEVAETKVTQVMSWRRSEGGRVGKGRACQVFRAAWNNRFIVRSRSPMSAITNMPRWSICCWRCWTIPIPPP